MPRIIDPELVRANERRAREVLEETAFTRDLGIELISLSPGEASARLPDSPRNHNTNGVAHGGVLYSLADTIASLAAASWGEGGVTVQGNISYLLPASGDLVCTARVVRYGSHVIFTEVSITDSRERCVCRGDFLHMQTPGRPQFGLQSVYRDT